MKRRMIGVIALTLSVLLSVFCLAGCGDSKSTDSKTETTKVETEEVKDSVLVGTWDANEAEGAAYVFDKDGTGKWDMSDYAMNFTYVDNGTTVEITYEGSSETQTWEYTIEDNTLTMKDTDTGTVLTYTKK